MNMSFASEPSFSSSSSSSSSSSFRAILEFIYENFTYILGIIIVMFGILVYIQMVDITFEPPMTRSKTLIIEGMEHRKGKTNGDDDDNNNGGGGNVNNSNVNNVDSGSTLLTQPIDLEKKLKSGFCNMHAAKGSSPTDIDNECKVFGKASCLNTDCCGWVVTTENPDGICRSGSKNGMTFGYDDSGKKIDVDCYYYKETKSGPRCS